MRPVVWKLHHFVTNRASEAEAQEVRRLMSSDPSVARLVEAIRREIESDGDSGQFVSPVSAMDLLQTRRKLAALGLTDADPVAPRGEPRSSLGSPGSARCREVGDFLAFVLQTSAVSLGLRGGPS